MPGVPAEAELALVRDQRHAELGGELRHIDLDATARVEDLIDELSESYAIVIVTHSMQQAARVSQRTAYFHLGRLIEVGDTDRIFTNPRHRLTEDYITGRFG